MHDLQLDLWSCYRGSWRWCGARNTLWANSRYMGLSGLWCNQGFLCESMIFPVYNARSKQSFTCKKYHKIHLRNESIDDNERPWISIDRVLICEFVAATLSRRLFQIFMARISWRNRGKRNWRDDVKWITAWGFTVDVILFSMFSYELLLYKNTIIIKY